MDVRDPDVALRPETDIGKVESGPGDSADASPDGTDAHADGAIDDSEDVAPDATIEASGCSDASGPVYVPDADDLTACSGSHPCTALGLICLGDNCNERWECLPHYQKHPCPMDSVPHCGCDGVTFQSPDGCADRPYEHIGECSDGANCDPTDLRCSDQEPTCAPGWLPSIVHGVYGPCIPFSSCRCEFLWECPHRDIYACDRTTWRCAELRDK